MLIVVKHGDLHGAPQLLFDLETIGRLYVFEVDPSEGWLQDLADTDDFFRVRGGQLQVENVDVGEAFEEDAFALHHRLARRGANVAEAQHCGAIRYDGNKIPFAGVAVNERRLPLDLETRDSDSGRV